MIQFLHPVKRPARALASALFFSLLAAAPAIAQTYTIRTLGPAPDNSFFSSTALAINNKSEVLVSGVFGLYDATPSLYLPVAAYFFKTRFTTTKASAYRSGTDWPPPPMISPTASKIIQN
ncbi:MAG: hypothetical protein ABI651_14370 [Verrucomicrobiota bacterium]